MCTPEPDDEHPLHAPIVGLVAGGPQPFVRRVEDRVPAIQTPHPLDQNEVRTAFQQDHGAPAGDNLEEDDAEAVDVGVCHHGAPPRAVVAERLVQHDVAWLDVAVHHALLPLLMEISQRGAQAEDDLVPMYTIKSISKRWTIYIIL